jgi:hypothetical protein
MTWAGRNGSGGTGARGSKLTLGMMSQDAPTDQERGESHLKSEGVSQHRGRVRGPGAADYKEQGPKIRSRTYLAPALGIHSVGARHAAWIRRLAGFLQAARAFDEPLSDGRVVEIVNSTHFVTLQAPTTSAPSSPGFTG